MKLKEVGNFSVGIIAKDKKYLEEFEKKFSGHKNVRVLTMPEAQGVEFDTVFIVGIDREKFSIPGDIPEELIREKKKIISDLLYIALTRAMTKMCVLGKDWLSEIAGKIVSS